MKTDKDKYPDAVQEYRFELQKELIGSLEHQGNMEESPSKQPEKPAETECAEEELNIVRTALIQSLRSMSKPLTDTYMRVFKDSADLDILHIFADLGYPEAQEELEFIWSLR